MFLVTLIDPRIHKLIRRAFHYLEDAEQYCDYKAFIGYYVCSLERCDLFEAAE
jgi:hypothetical protein